MNFRLNKIDNSENFLSSDDFQKKFIKLNFYKIENITSEINTEKRKREQLIELLVKIKLTKDIGIWNSIDPNILTTKSLQIIINNHKS